MDGWWAGTPEGRLTVGNKEATYWGEAGECQGVACGGTPSSDETTRAQMSGVVKKAGGGRPRSAFARVRGSATERMSTDEIMALTRGEA